MRHFLLIGLMAAGMWTVSVNLSAQVIKTDPKPEPKMEPKAPKFVWPDKIQGKNLDFWVREMKESRDASTREEAIRTLSSFGPEATRAASPNLINAITKDPDINVRLTAISMVPTLGFDEANLDVGLTSLVNIINPKLSASPNHTRYEATMALGNCGPVAKRAIPVLIEYTIIDPTSWHNRKAAVYALGRLGVATDKDKGPDVVVAKALSKCLRLESSHQVRREAINSIMLLGPPFLEAAWKDVRDALTHGMRDPNHSIAIWSRVAFIRTEHELIKSNDPNLMALVKFLGSSDLLVKAEALEALGYLGDEAKSRIADIIALATTKSEKPEDLGMAVTAIWVLSQMPAETGQLLPIFDQLKRHKEEGIKQAADIAYRMLVLRKDDPDKKEKKDPKDAKDPKKDPLKKM